MCAIKAQDRKLYLDQILVECKLVMGMIRTCLLDMKEGTYSQPTNQQSKGANFVTSKGVCPLPSTLLQPGGAAYIGFNDKPFEFSSYWKAVKLFCYIYKI